MQWAAHDRRGTFEQVTGPAYQSTLLNVKRAGKAIFSPTFKAPGSPAATDNMPKVPFTITAPVAVRSTFVNAVGHVQSAALRCAGAAKKNMESPNHFFSNNQNTLQVMCNDSFFSNLRDHISAARSHVAKVMLLSDDAHAGRCATYLKELSQMAILAEQSNQKLHSTLESAAATYNARLSRTVRCWVTTLATLEKNSLQQGARISAQAEDLKLVALRNELTKGARWRVDAVINSDAPAVVQQRKLVSVLTDIILDPQSAVHDVALCKACVKIARAARDRRSALEMWQASERGKREALQTLARHEAAEAFALDVDAIVVELQAVVEQGARRCIRALKDTFTAMQTTVKLMTSQARMLPHEYRPATSMYSRSLKELVHQALQTFCDNATK